MTGGVFDEALTQALYHDLRRANTEAAKKERFLQYVTALFAGDAGAQAFVSALSLGAERTIANIPRGERLTFGRADSQTETVIIEWERDLARTGEHARHQLEEYLEGNWRSGQAYRFVLIATDGLRWRCYAPDWSRLEVRDFSLGSRFELRETRRFDLAQQNAADFPFFLDDVLFVTRPKLATLENIQGDFGDTSATFINSIVTLTEAAGNIEEQSELQVAFEQWRRFLSVAYGRFDDSPQMFLVHTYLSVFAKLLAFCVVNGSPAPDEDTTRSVLDGEVFQRLNVDRFVEDDFFHWVHADEHFSSLRHMFREINRQLLAYDFAEVREDILKGLYQELIDLDTRHALGEYYTPDWLCERLVAALELTPTSRVLDPACGSGSFLRATATELLRLNPTASVDELARQIVGIDIHPLSVQIAKTTVLLALGNRVAEAERPVSLQIYLANSLTVPQETADLFENSFRVTVDNEVHVLDVRGFTSADDFDRLITLCDELVKTYNEPLERERFARLATPYVPMNAATQLPYQLHDVYLAMKRADTEGRDTIWKFILQNSYKPIFLAGRFDVVVGNPPWLTYSGVSNHEYQNLLLQLSEEYRVTPRRANMPHLEIAAIFLAHSANYFLAEGGRVAFVLPRSFVSADQHENTRAGTMAGLRLLQVWDLEGVSPLFRVPCCVLIGRKASATLAANPLPLAGLPGLRFTGRLPRAHLHWADAQHRLHEEPVRWFYSRLQDTRGRSPSALTNERASGFSGTNAYADLFTQGATIVPRNFFFVEVDGIADHESASMRDRVLSLRTTEASNVEAKAPWRDKRIARRAEGQFLFRTAISRSIVPFALVDPPLVLLPLIEVEGEGSNPARYEVLESEALMAMGARYASGWFAEADRIWNAHRTEKNAARETTLIEYLNWQGKLTGQNPASRYLVIYTSSSSDASACVVDRTTFDHPFVVDHKAYWCAFDSLQEAHFVAGYLNSNWANDTIKDFQSRGLFGPRDIHKTILKLPFPRFRPSDPDHRALADLSAACASAAIRFIEHHRFGELTSRLLGRVRSQLRGELSSDLESIDVLVSKLATGRSEATMRARGRRRRPQAAIGPLI